jgi:hypothetical protein
MRTLRGQFILYASLILLLAAMLTLICSTTVSRTSSDLATIDSGSIPSVNDAQRITALIESIDAQAADYLATAGLTSTTACTLAGSNTSIALTTHDCDERNIDAETVQVNQTLFLAAHNTTYIGEQTAIERITIGLEGYLADIHQMRVNYGLALHKTDAADPYLQRAYQAYLNASHTLHDQIGLTTLGADQIPFNKEGHLPNCTLPDNPTLTPDQWTQGSLTTALDCLSSINYTHLQGAYGDTGNFLSSSIAWIALLGTLLCVLLIAGNARMTLKAHRLINPGLLAAALIGLIFGFTLLSLLSSVQGQGATHSQDGAFTQLVQDDYASIYDAALLNRVATDTNADESRWLIALEFNDQTNLAHWQDDWNQNVRQANALITQAHDNQTWTEELQPLRDMDTYWNQYSILDGEIRVAAQQQDDPKRLLNAETISTGASNQAFTQFSDAVLRLAQANQEHYNQTFQSINTTLMLHFLLSLILLPLSGLLTLWGVAIRLKDF